METFTSYPGDSFHKYFTDICGYTSVRAAVIQYLSTPLGQSDSSSQHTALDTTEQHENSLFIKQGSNESVQKNVGLIICVNNLLYN